MHVAWPADEAARLDALAALNWPSTSDDPRLDDIVALAADFLSAPIAVVSLTEKDRQVAIASLGMGRVSVAREASFCTHTVAAGEMRVVLDAAHDPLFAANPFVLNAPCVRFYAGAPLWSEDGFCLGTLCVIDVKPRDDFAVAERAALSRLAGVAERRLQERSLRRRAEAAEAGRAAADARTHAILGEAAGAFVACDRLALNLGGRMRAALTRARRAHERGGGHVLENELSALGEIVTDLIGVARLERGSAPQPDVIAPGQILGAVVADNAPQAPARGVALAFDDLSAGAEMLCDPWRLEELLDHLVEDCLALSRANMTISCGFEAAPRDGHCRFAIRLSSTAEGPPWRISARSRELTDCLGGGWELDQIGRRIGVFLPARLRTTLPGDEPVATPSNIIPFTRVSQEGKA